MGFQIHSFFFAFRVLFSSYSIPSMEEISIFAVNNWEWREKDVTSADETWLATRSPFGPLAGTKGSFLARLLLFLLLFFRFYEIETSRWQFTQVYNTLSSFIR